MFGILAYLYTTVLNIFRRDTVYLSLEDDKGNAYRIIIEGPIATYITLQTKGEQIPAFELFLKTINAVKIIP